MEGRKERLTEVLSSLLAGGCEDVPVDIDLYLGHPEATTANEVKLTFLLIIPKKSTTAVKTGAAAVMIPL